MFEISNLIENDRSIIPRFDGLKISTSIHVKNFYEIADVLNINITAIYEETITRNVYDLKEKIKTDIDNVSSFNELTKVINVVTRIIDRLCDNCSVYSSRKVSYMQLRCGFLKKYFGHHFKE